MIVNNLNKDERSETIIYVKPKKSAKDIRCTDQYIHFSTLKDFSKAHSYVSGRPMPLQTRRPTSHTSPPCNSLRQKLNSTSFNTLLLQSAFYEFFHIHTL